MVLKKCIKVSNKTHLRLMQLKYNKQYSSMDELIRKEMKLKC